MNIKPKLTPGSLANIAAHLWAGSYSRPAFSALFNAKSAVIQKSVIVPDVSFWQPDIDFLKMKANGAAGVIIRAGQGGWDDTSFPSHWDASRGLFPRGVYWFYDSRYTPGSQALRIKNLFANRTFPEMELWCDYEENYGGPYAGWKHFAVFIDEVRRLIPWAKVGIYTGYYYWLAHSPNPITEKASFEWFAQFPLWLAWYTADPSIVKIPQPWPKVTYWQYTSTGDGPAYGLRTGKGIDLSGFNGTRDEFNARYNVSTPPPPPDPTPAIPILKKVTLFPAPKVSTDVLAEMELNGVTYYATKTIDPIVTPPPVEPPAEPPAAEEYPYTYRIKDDIEAGVQPEGTRPYFRGEKGLPCTVRFRGVNSANKLTQPWIDYVSRCNGGDKKRMNYIFKEASGWQNSAEQYKVETVTFGGNIVKGTAPTTDGKVYVKCFHMDDPPPAVAIVTRENKLDPLVHMFSIQYKNRLDMSTDGRYCLILMICEKGGKPYMDSRDLVRVA